MNISRKNLIVKMETHMSRPYRKTRRSAAQDETREKIVRATMALHLEKGVATTSYPDIAARAGVGAATVYRHFPTMDSLVDACGAQFQVAIDPPTPDRSAAIFAGLDSRADRLVRLVDELDAFYMRAEAPLWSAVRDQDRIAPLGRFLAEVNTGVAGLVAEALREAPGSQLVRVVAALTDFMVWRALTGTGLDSVDRKEIQVAVIAAAISDVAVLGTRRPVSEE